MLDITFNNQQASGNIGGFCNGGASIGASYGIADDLDLAAELLTDDDLMDPLFDEDWLHENNLDILFDLFEEEIESKVNVVEANTGPSSLYGTSPVTSYLFGTSPSLASTLDLLYFDSQQQQPQCTTIGSNLAGNLNTSSTNINNSDSNKSTSTFNNSNNVQLATKGSSTQQVVGGITRSMGTGNAVTNAMRIKRGLKRGQSEGISLLAKPSTTSRPSSSLSTKAHHSGCNKSSSSSKPDGISGSGSGNKLISKNNSDKTSVKITNFKNSIIIGNCTNQSIIRTGIDISYSKQSQQQQKREKVYLHTCQHHHAHQMTGRSIYQEHAYAVRGH